MEFALEPLTTPSIADLVMEIVERKGRRSRRMPVLARRMLSRASGRVTDCCSAHDWTLRGFDAVSVSPNRQVMSDIAPMLPDGVG